MNTYGYVANNPLIGADPTGEIGYMIPGIIVGIGVAACGSFYTLLKGIKECDKKFPNHDDLIHPDYRAHIQCTADVAGVIALGIGLSIDPIGSVTSGAGGAVGCNVDPQCN